MKNANSDRHRNQSRAKKAHPAYADRLVTLLDDCPGRLKELEFGCAPDDGPGSTPGAEQVCAAIGEKQRVETHQYRSQFLINGHRSRPEVPARGLGRNAGRSFYWLNVGRKD